MKKIIMILFLTSAIHAGGLFSVGHKNFGFTVGSSTGYGNTYTVVGINANYFITDNLSVGAGYTGWFGDDPKINEISFPVTYYMPTESSYKPYVGAVYRHTFIDEPYDDHDVYGGRLGVAIVTGSNSFMSIGWVQEYYDNGVDGSDSRGYPEINAGFTF
jgi:hypothetical protein